MDENEITKRIASFIREKGINLSELSRKTKIPYAPLYASLGGGKRDRPLTVEEAVKICKFMGVKVEDFAEENKN